MSGLLIDSEKKLYECYINSSAELIKHYNFLREKVVFNLTEKEISAAILLRLKAYYNSQVKIKEFLGKRYMQQELTFLLKLYFFI
ncbi:MAG: hypothetical protein PWP71_1720 [Clostridia bacterium]|jgi:hypothetical protein|nr:hypothetical protein [Clostridia bacterium]